MGSVFEKAFRYVFLAVITYLIVPDAYGQFVFVVSTLTLLYGFINLNLHRSISHFVPRFLEADDTDQATGFVLRIAVAMTVIGLSTGLVVTVFAPRIASLTGNPDTVFLFTGLAALSPLYAFRDVFGELFRSFERVRYIALTQSILFPVLQLIMTVAALMITSAIMALVLGITVAWVLTLVASLVLLSRLPLDIEQARSPDVSWRRLLDYSIPLFGAGIIGSVLTQIDLILLGILSDDPAVAFFKIAFSVAAIGKMVPQMFKTISKPLFAKAATGTDETSLSEFYLTTARWGALVTIPAAVFLLVEYETLVSVLFANEYSTASLAVPIIVLGNAVATFFGYHGMLLEATNHTRVLLLRGIVMLTVNVILDVVLIPEFGIVGAAIGTSTALAVGTLVELAATVRFEIDRLPLTGYHVRYLIVGALVGTILWVTPVFVSPLVGVVLDGAILGLAYPLGCVLFHGLTSEDAEIIQRAVDRLERETGLRLKFAVKLAYYGAGVRRSEV